MMSFSVVDLGPLRQHQDVAMWQLATRIAAALPSVSGQNASAFSMGTFGMASIHAATCKVL